MLKKIKRLIISRRGEGYVDVAISFLVIMIMIVAILNISPVFITKMSLNNYANELCREAEIAGRIGAETTARLERLNEGSSFTPTVTWSETGKIQIGQTFTVTVSTPIDISFYIFSSAPIVISSSAEGTSEVFWK